MRSPQDAALRHRLSSIRAVILSLEADLAVASTIGKPDVELLLSFFKDAEQNGKNEIELHHLTHGGIDALKRAGANPERYISNAPAPPMDISDRGPRLPRPSREELIARKKTKLDSELQKAEARSSELDKSIVDWYLKALPEWDRVTADARTRQAGSQGFAIEQYSALKLRYEQMLSSQDHTASKASGVPKSTVTTPPDSPFRWAEIDAIAKEKLEALVTELRSEVKARLAPYPKYSGERRRFLLMLADEANDWVDRAEKAYGQCLAEIGRDWTYDVTHLIWNYGLSDFIGAQIRGLLLLSCGMDDKERELLFFRSYKNYPTPDNVIDARVKANEVNRIVENLKKAWSAKLSQRAASDQTSWLFKTQELLHEIDPKKHSAPPLVNLTTMLTFDQPTGPIESPSQPGELEAHASDDRKLESLLKRMESPKDHATFRTTEAALVLNVSTETVNRWVRANKLTKGSKRSTILISSVKRKLGTMKNPV